MILTPRLLKIAQMVSYTSAADIGTDHAKLPVYLVEKNICSKVIASDVADGPVHACKKTVKHSGKSNQIDVRKGYGLKKLSKGEVDTIIIAGMGGDLISEILKNDLEICTSSKEIILQPMTHISQLRAFLHNNGFCIADEVLVREKNKIYTIIKTTKGENQYTTEFDYIVSPFLINKKDPLLKDFVGKLLEKYSKEYIGLKSATVVDEDLMIKTKLIINNLEKIYEAAKNY
ncbi:MAG: SAM-dependent methyltransferase [Clostridia bacterium]|nr:SAM-dependent methyltransferase [Clostridia bacterium]